jgi:uncharacterized protein YjbJ (UPF0337 family)
MAISKTFKENKMNQQTVSGNWLQLRGKIREEWGNLTNDELDTARGSMEQLVGMIEQKTGETRDVIEKKLDQFHQGTGDTAESVADAVRQYGALAAETAQSYANAASETLMHSSDQVKEGVVEGYRQTEAMVKARPFESLAATFGAGLIAGVVIGILVKHR